MAKIPHKMKSYMKCSPPNIPLKVTFQIVGILNSSQAKKARGQPSLHKIPNIRNSQRNKP